MIGGRLLSAYEYNAKETVALHSPFLHRKTSAKSCFELVIS